MAYKITPARSNKKKEEESYSDSSLRTTTTPATSRRMTPARQGTVMPARQTSTASAQPKSVRRDFNNGLFSLVDGYSNGIRMARQNGSYDSNKWDDQYKKIKGFLDENKEQIGSNYYNALVEKMNVTRKGANSLPAYGGVIDRSRPVFEQPKSGSKEDALKYVNRATGASTPQTVQHHQNMALAKNTYDYLAGGGSTDAFSYADLKDYQQMAPKVSDYYNKLTEAWNARNSGEQTVGNLQLTADEAQRNAEAEIRKRNNYPDYWSFDNFTDEEKQEVNDARAAAENGYTQEPKTMPAEWTMTGNINTANEMIGREMDSRDFQKKYAQLTYNDDFAENSRYQRKFLDRQDVELGGQDARKNAELLTSLYGNDSYMKKYNDIYYEAVNGNQDAMYFLRNVKNPNTGEVNYSADSFVEEYMNDYEREIFNYTFATQGADAAREYVDGIRYDLTKRAFYAADEEFRERLKNADLVSLGLANLASVPLNLAQGAANFLGQSAEMIMGRQVNPYSYENTAGTIRDVTEQKIVTAVEEAGGGDFAKTLASMGYNAFMSGLDSSLSLALGSGVAETLGLAGGAADSVTKYISLGLMSSGAASNTLNNELMMGIPQGRAALDSMTAGLIEFATEQIGMDNLFNNIINGRGNFVSYMKQVLAEGAEELVGDVATDAINQLYDIIGNTSYSELNRQANAYWLENGMAPSQRNEAMAHVLLDRLQEYAIDTAVGSLSVITGEGSVGAIANFNNAKALTSHLDASTAQDVIREGLTLDPNSRAYKGAMALQERMLNQFNPVAINAREVQKLARNIVYEVQGIENDTDRKQAEQDMFKAFGIDRFLHPDVQTTTEQPRTTNDPNAGEFEVNRAEDDAVKAAQDAEQKRIDTSTINSIINEATNNNPTVNPDEIARRVHNVTEQDSADDLSDVLTPEQIQTVAEIASRNSAAQAVQTAMDAIAEKSVPVRQEEETVQETIEEEPATEQEQPSMEVDTSGFANTLTPAARQVYEQTLDEARQRGMNAADATQAFLEVYTAGTHQMPYAPTQNNQRLSGATRAMISQTAQRESTEYTTKLEQKGFAKSAAAGTQVQTSKGLVATPVLARAVQDGRISQRTADVMNKLGQMLGVRINVLSTNPKYNGEYKAQQADINLYLDAKFFNSKTTDEAVIGVLGHELSHRLEDISPEAYRQLTTMVMKTMGSSGFARMVEHNMRLAPGMTILDAQGEVVSDFVGTMLFRDSDFADRFLGNVKVDTAEQRTALQGLRDFVHKVIDWIRGNKDAFKEPEKAITWMEKLENTLTNLIEQSAEAVGESTNVVTPESVQAMGIAIDETSESAFPTDGTRFSQKTWNESDYVKQRNEAARDMAKALDISEKKAKAYIDTVNGVAKYIADNATRLDYIASNGGSAFVSNSEYGGSFDFTTMCKKARLFMGTFSAVQRQLGNNALTANEVLELRDLMKKKGYEVTCGCCYVEGSRANEGQFALKFMELYGAYYPDNWQPELGDLNTPDGIEWTRINHPECYEQYMSFWNNHGKLRAEDPNLFASQQKPKMYQARTAYNGEILTNFKKAETIDQKNHNGGIRMQSFSDFEIVHLIDVMQTIMDMSRVGLAGQAYTKVYDFADAFGDTGLKINLSLIAKGVDENGDILIDPVEGMKKEDAIKLRDKYSDNVGTIIVCFNDAEVLAAMKSDFIDFIIPFHRSQWKKSQYGLLGLPEKVKDYTNQQNEKLIQQTYHMYQGRMVKDKASNFMPNNYWDFSLSGKENAERYLRLCAENNKRPKFYKFLTKNADGSYALKADGSTDGYWKLLIDFKMYNNEGKGVPQMPVTPNFRMDEINNMLQSYEGGHSSFPVANNVVEEFTNKYKNDHDIRYSYRGENSNLAKADMENLELARELETSGETNETIRLATGWFRGYDGKWRNEIDDSKIKFRNIPSASDVEWRNTGEVANLIFDEMTRELTSIADKMQGKIWNSQEMIGLRKQYDKLEKEIKEYRKYVDRAERNEYYLSDIVDHQKLYKAYPQLKQLKVSFYTDNYRDAEASNNVVGINRGNGSIAISVDRKLNDIARTIMHEVQHEIQNIEGFAKGASTAWWAAHIKPSEEVKQAEAVRNDILKKLEAIEYHGTPAASPAKTALMYEYYQKSLREDKAHNLTANVKYDEQKIKDIENRAKENGYYDDLVNYLRAAQDLEVAKAENRQENPADLYYMTAGEVEARDVADRLDLNAKQRRATSPDINRKNVVFTENPDFRYSVKDADYLAAVNAGDMEAAQRMVDDAAMQIPTIATEQRGRLIRPKHLYHGTRFFGFTQFKDSNYDVPFIYTSSDRTVSAHYAGDNHYAGVRNIGRKYDGGSSIESIIKDAETVWGRTYHVATEAEKNQAFKKVRDDAIKIADRIDELHTDLGLSWDNDDDVKISNQIAWVENLFWVMRDSDFTTLEELQSEEITYTPEDFMSDIRAFENAIGDVKKYYTENYKKFTPEQKKYLGFLQGYEVGDAAIDIQYRIGKILENDTLLADRDGYFAVPEAIRESLDQVHNIGAYDLYGDLGSNPFEFDADGAQFWAVKVPQMGDGYYSTDQICKWAYEHGYSSVIMRNIYDYGDKADNYVFFDTSQLKSADPVTYDDAGNVIPLSERFNTENQDIRYSLKDNPNAQVGININDSTQAFTDQILDGLKTVETRNTPSLRPYVGQRVALVRTGKGKATVVGYATISEEIRYPDANSFYADRDKHLVDRGSRYSFENSTSGEKYGYVLTDVEREDNPYVVTEKGNVARDVDRNVQSRYSRRDTEAVDDFRSIVERNQQREQTKVVLDAASSWRNKVTKLDTRKLRAGTEAILKDFSDTLTKDQQNQIVYKVNKLANDIIQNKKLGYMEIEDRATEIASDIVFKGAGVDDATARDNMLNNAAAEEAIDYLTNLLMANIVTTQSAETSRAIREVQRQIERNDKLKDTLREVRAKRDQKIREDIDRRKAQREKRRDSKERTYLLKVMNRLEGLAKKSSAEQAEEIRNIIGEFDLTCKGLTEGKAAKLEELKEWVDQRMQEDPLGFAPNPNVLKAIEGLSQKHIANLTIDEVRNITRALLNIEHEIREGKYLAGVADRRDTNALGREVIEGVNNSRDKAIKHTKGIDGLYNEVVRPETFFRRLIGFDNNNPLYQLTFGDELSLSTGQRAMINYNRRAHEKYFRQYLDDKAFQKSIIGKHARAVEIRGIDENGTTVTLKVTPDLLMAIYMHGKNDQNLKHFVDMENRVMKDGKWTTEIQKAGGMTVPDFELYKAGKIEEAYRKGTKITMKRADVRHIASQLTPKEMGYIHAAQRYYSEMSQPEINRVSEILNGYSLANVDNYFRINTDKAYIKADSEAIKFDAKIESQGWTKERMNASNPIMLYSLTDQLQRDIDGHSKYVGLAIPIRNFDKVRGVNQYTYNDDGSVKTAYASSVVKAIDKMYGKKALDYINKLMADIQMPQNNQDFFGKLLAKVRGHYAGAVLTLNLGVSIKQSASYPTAAAEIGWLPLVKAMGNFSAIKANRLNMDLVYKYSPLMRLRTEGISTQELGEMKEQGRSIPKLLNWIQGMDVATVKKLWKASEYYVRANFKNLQVGSDAYYKKVGDVHTAVITKTQPNYTALQRPQILRTSNELVRTLNMFKTQPFQNLNILMESFGELKAAQRAYKINGTDENRARLATARKRAGWAVSSHVVSNLIFAAMSFAAAFIMRRDDKYRDEEDELAAGTVFRKILIDMLGSDFGMMPFGSAIFETVETATDKIAKEINPDAEPIFDAVFYGIDAGTATDSINDSLKGIVNLLSNGVSLTRDLISKAQNDDFDVDWEGYTRDAVEDVMDVLMFAGVPAENGKKSAVAIAGWILEKVMGRNLAKYWTTKIVDGVKSGNKTALIKNLINTKDPDQYEQLYNTMINEPDFGTSTKDSKKYIDDKLKTWEKSQTANGMTFENQSLYDDITEELHASTAYKNAKAADQATMDQFAEDLVLKTAKAWTNARTAIENDIFTASEYLTFMLELEKANQANTEGSKDAYSKDEQEAAIKAMGWTDAQAKKYWEYLPKGDTKNPFDPDAKTEKKDSKKEETKKEDVASKYNLVSATEGPKKQSDKKKTAPQDGTLNSSWLGGYHYSNGTLQLQVNGAWYTYNNVPEEVFQGLLDAPSAGSYFSYNIKGRY